MYNPADVRAVMEDPPPLSDAKRLELEALQPGRHAVACAGVEEYVAIQTWALANRVWPVSHDDVSITLQVD